MHWFSLVFSVRESWQIQADAAAEASLCTREWIPDVLKALNFCAWGNGMAVQVGCFTTTLWGLPSSLMTCPIQRCPEVEELMIGAWDTVKFYARLSLGKISPDIFFSKADWHPWILGCSNTEAKDSWTIGGRWWFPLNVDLASLSSSPNVQAVWPVPAEKEAEDSTVHLWLDCQCSPLDVSGGPAETSAWGAI